MAQGRCLKHQEQKNLKDLFYWVNDVSSFSPLPNSVWLLSVKMRPQAQSLGFPPVEHDLWDNWSIITKDNGIWRTVRLLQFPLVPENFSHEDVKEARKVFLHPITIREKGTKRPLDPDFPPWFIPKGYIFSILHYAYELLWLPHAFVFCLQSAGWSAVSIDIRHSECKF